jgi:ribosomal protein L13E
MEQGDKKAIATVMSVCGHKKYFEYAKYSIDSFQHSNPGYSLFVFTTNKSYFNDCIFSSDVHFINFEEMLKRVPKAVVQHIEKETLAQMKDFIYQDRRHTHYYVSMLMPMAHTYLKDISLYTHILKIDCDSYFVGRMMDMVLKEIEVVDYPLYLVERQNEHMLVRHNTEGFKVGVGFTLWKKESSFMNAYINNFEVDEQRTISGKLYEKRCIPVKILQRPGYHFVYPFKKNPRFDKRLANRFVPAYFHLTGTNIVEHQKLLTKWYG